MKAKAEQAGATGDLWATEERLEEASVEAVQELSRQMTLPSRPAAQAERPLKERLEEAVAARDAAKARLDALPTPAAGEGHHLPWYRAWENAAREFHVADELVNVLQKAA